MLSPEAWWGVISNYNQTIFPFQIVVILVGIAATLYLFLGNNTKANILMKAYLSFCNLWIGIVFFLFMCDDFPSPLKEIQGTLFIVIGILFAVDIFRKKTEIVIEKTGTKRYVSVFLLSLIVLYPLIGLILRGYEETIYPGTLPCATTAFALILLVGSLPKVDKLVYILLLVWAVPFPVAIQIPIYHVYEDSIMFIIGVYSLIMIILTTIKSKKKV